MEGFFCGQEEKKGLKASSYWHFLGNLEHSCERCTLNLGATTPAIGASPQGRCRDFTKAREALRKPVPQVHLVPHLKFFIYIK